jgi:hypothetical protein
MIRFLLLWLIWVVPYWSLAQTLPVDSLPPATTQDFTAVAYRYVNATSLTLRAHPDVVAAALATVGGASRVYLLQTRPDGWSQVQLAQYVGYVKSDYLIDSQEAVTAEVDWASIEAAGGSAYSSITPLVPADTRALPVSPVRRVMPKVATGPKVYICGNGRTEVYHSSESCAAMRRCTYQTIVLSQREAQASGLRGCLKCY